jgi:hypothetical protein
MALNKANATAATFEAEDETLDQAADTGTAEAVTVEATDGAVATSEAPKTTALAAAGTRALTTASSVMKANIISGLQDAFRVEYDSLPAVGASLGTFVRKADETDLGPELKLQLISYQESWVASPNDTKADVELVKYADNSKTARDGTDLAAHVEDLKAQGYGKAKINHRVILVGELLEAPKDDSMVGDLIMVDLPDSGRRSFNTFTLQASYAVAKGRKSAEEATILTLKAVNDKTKSGEKYTKVVIS